MVHRRLPRRAVATLWCLGAFSLAISPSCRGPQPSSAVLTAEAPLHLAAHLEAATVEGSELPPNPPAAREWRFDEPQPDWKPVGYAHPSERLPEVRFIEDAVRLTLSNEEGPRGWKRPWGGLYTDLPDWNLEDWAYVIVTLRASDQFRSLELGLNLNTDADSEPSPAPFDAWVPSVPVIDDGSVALWGAPVLSGERVAESRSSRPNVIFYIIDGGGADYMSVNGYNRANTPHLEDLAKQGAMFERAHSSATWTKPSTASFMTSIPHSALGGYRSGTDRVPDGAVTMAELLHAAGYQTAVIVSNPYSASLSGLERGADFMHETGIEPNNSESSKLLHESFWRWRENHPTEPYWVHFQSTDIHEPFNPVPPFSGLYIDPELRQAYEEWDPKLYGGGGGWRDPAAYKELGIDQARYTHAQQGLYDEAMAHNDYRIGELVARLRERGEWENTLLIVAADHGYPAACHRLMEPLPPIWGPMFNSHETRVPMIFVWPGHIPAGQRFTAPVSMMDVMPTILDLLKLPVPETAMGQSLAPLLLGQGDWQPQPVILDEFNVDSKTGEMKGLIEVVDGWWGASLEIGEGAANDLGTMGAASDEHRPAPLLLYDLRNDPFTQHSLHEERPDLVEKYRRLLQRQWATHRALRKTLGEGGQVTVGQEQLEALRALGYID